MEYSEGGANHDQETTLGGSAASSTKAVTRRTSVLDRISQIKVPTLVIVGSEDIATTPDKAQRLAEGISGARLETIAGAGHMTPIEQPERISQLLSEFLSEADSASPK